MLCKRQIMKIKRSELRKLIESFISGPKGTMHVPDTDPYEDLDPKIKQKFSRETVSSNQLLRNQIVDLDAAFKDGPDLDDDDVLSPVTGAELERSMKVFDDPMGQYDHQSGFHGDVDKIIEKISDKYQTDLGLEVDYRKVNPKFPERGESVTITSQYRNYIEDIRDELVARGHLVVNLNYSGYGIYDGIVHNQNGTFSLSTFDNKSSRFDR